MMKDPRRVGNREAKTFLHEADNIELDQAFPVASFAP
jgi:hypothetical protein